MTEVKALAQVIAQGAIRTALEHVTHIQGALPEPKLGLEEQMRAAAERVVTQDPAARSWRVWGAVWSGLTAVLILPEVQTAIHAIIGQMLPPEYLPIATAILGVIWPLVSKIRDPRPARNG